MSLCLFRFPNYALPRRPWRRSLSHGVILGWGSRPCGLSVFHGDGRLVSPSSISRRASRSSPTADLMMETFGDRLRLPYRHPSTRKTPVGARRAPRGSSALLKTAFARWRGVLASPRPIQGLFVQHDRRRDDLVPEDAAEVGIHALSLRVKLALPITLREIGQRSFDHVNLLTG